MDEVQSVVIGAGVVGLAVARALALSGREVIVVDRNGTFGMETSSRNSEVVHAGIYYPTGSLKAELCVTGRSLLYRYCVEHSVPHRRIGKLIVATQDGQRDQLVQIRDRADANGVGDLRLIGAAELARMEPDLDASEGLLSPSTGIVDGHAFMRSLHRDAVEAGAVAVFRSPVVGGEVSDGRIVVRVDGESTVACRELVNCAGLHAWEIARSVSGFPADRIPARHLAKGNYFTLSSGRAPFSHLIYPVPADGGLGVHLTLDLAGQARFGPDVEWIDATATGASDYTVDPGRADRFYAEIRRYWPSLGDDSLTPAYSGIRPKVSGPGEPAADFVISGPSDHGVPGVVNLFGIESPGLTSSLAIAEHVTAILDARRANI